MPTKYNVVIETPIGNYNMPEIYIIPSRGDVIKFKTEEWKFVVTEVVWSLDETQNGQIGIIVKTSLVKEWMKNDSQV